MSGFDKFDLANRRILLVGATGILGRGYAATLAEVGANLVIADRPQSDVVEYAAELGVPSVTMDVGEEASVVSGVSAAIEKLGGGLDGCVMNAAITGEGLMAEGEAFADFEEYPFEVWQKTIDINLSGTFLVCREAGRAMKASGGGSFVTVSSIYGVVAPDHRIYDDQPFKSFAGYSASKAGVLGLTQWLSTWWAKDNIRVNSLSPGGVFNGHNDAFVEAYANRTPMGRMADRGDMTGTVLYLLSDASSYCTGQNFVVDGGLSVW